MTFIQALEKWFSFIFGAIVDITQQIFGTYWLAFGVVAVLAVYWLLIIADIVPSPREMVMSVREMARDHERHQCRQERAMKDQQRKMMASVKNHKYDYAQRYMGLTGNENFSYITIEEKGIIAMA